MKRSHKFFIGTIFSLSWTTVWITFNSLSNPHDYNTNVLFSIVAGFIVLGVGSTLFCFCNGLNCVEKGI